MKPSKPKQETLAIRLGYQIQIRMRRAASRPTSAPRQRYAWASLLVLEEFCLFPSRFPWEKRPPYSAMQGAIRCVPPTYYTCHRARRGQPEKTTGRALLVLLKTNGIHVTPRPGLETRRRKRIITERKKARQDLTWARKLSRRRSRM